MPGLLTLRNGTQWPFLPAVPSAHLSPFQELAQLFCPAFPSQLFLSHESLQRSGLPCGKIALPLLHRSVISSCLQLTSSWRPSLVTCSSSQIAHSSLLCHTAGPTADTLHDIQVSWLSAIPGSCLGQEGVLINTHHLSGTPHALFTLFPQ